MLNVSNSIFATGKMVINGVSSSSAADKNSSGAALERASLRIGGSSSISSTAADSQETTAPKKKVVENFASTLLSRLNDIQTKGATENQKTFEESQALVDSVTAAIDEIKNQFGQEAANQAMAAILSNTEDTLSGDRVATAINGVLQQIAGLNNAVLKDQSVTAEKYAEAKDTEQQLKDFVEYLNKGTAGGEKEISGLSGALNSYFGRSELPEEDQKLFTDDFSWMTSAEISTQEAQKNFSNTDIPLSVAEFGRDNADKLANYLRNELGHEEAADYIANLADDDDIFLAVDRVRGMLYENSGIVMPDDDPSTGMLGLARLDGEGVQQAHQLTRFLNGEMLDAVNSALRDNPQLNDRLKAYASRYYEKEEDIPAGLGLTAWPGGMINAYAPGEKPGQGNIGSIYLADIGETTAADRQAQFMQKSSEFWRETSQNTGSKNVGQYLQYAENCDKAYNEYLAAAKQYPTKPGQMVSQSI